MFKGYEVVFEFSWISGCKILIKDGILFYYNRMQDTITKWNDEQGSQYIYFISSPEEIIRSRIIKRKMPLEITSIESCERLTKEFVGRWKNLNTNFIRLFKEINGV